LPGIQTPPPLRAVESLAGCGESGCHAGATGADYDHVIGRVDDDSVVGLHDKKL
jgi:hypothetical protein